MARKSKTVSIEGGPENRDSGKLFFVEEMDAFRAERWASRAFLAIMKAGGDVQGYTAGGGWEQLAKAGFNSLGHIDPEIAQDLWNELMACVKVQPNPGDLNVKRELLASDIEEIQTIIQLKLEAFNIHANFSQAGVKSNMTSQTTPAPSLSNAPMSPPQLQPSFHPARQPSRISRRPSVSRTPM